MKHTKFIYNENKVRNDLLELNLISDISNQHVKLKHSKFSTMTLCLKHSQDHIQTYDRSVISYPCKIPENSSAKETASNRI